MRFHDYSGTWPEYSFIASKHEYCISILNRGSKPQLIMISCESVKDESDDDDDDDEHCTRVYLTQPCTFCITQLPSRNKYQLSIQCIESSSSQHQQKLKTHPLNESQKKKACGILNGQARSSKVEEWSQVYYY